MQKILSNHYYHKWPEKFFSIEGDPNILLEYSMAGVVVGAFQSTSHFRFITERDCDRNSWKLPNFDTEGDW